MKFLFFIFIVSLVSCDNSVENTNIQSIKQDTITHSNDYNIFVEDEDRMNQYLKAEISCISNKSCIKDKKTLLAELLKYFSFHDEKLIYIADIDEIYIHGCVESIINVKVKTDRKNCKFADLYRNFLFDSSGKLIFTFSNISSFVKKIMPDSTDCLVAYNRKCNGMGNYHFYICVENNIVDIINNISDKDINTYDINPENGLYVNGRLEFNVNHDYNGDNFNDLVFEGERLFFNPNDSIFDEEHSYKKEDVKYIYNFYPSKNQFIFNN